MFTKIKLLIITTALTSPLLLVEIAEAGRKNS